MWRLGRTKKVQPPEIETQAIPGSRRERLAWLLALVTIVCLGAALFISKGTQLLMPGPLTSVHGAIEKCSTCHTKSGSGKLSWFHGLVAADPLADSNACLACHKMPDTAFNAHGASTEVLKRSTKRLKKVASGSTVPPSASAQSIAFPMGVVMKGPLYCATCHQEHQGVSFNLNRISNEQCRSCHVVKFDSFDGNHPKFESFPFKRRTRIVYDHAEHFGKHFPEVAKKDPAKRIPPTCSTCHDSGNDKRVMAVVPFDQTCSACHLDQIVGKERVSGPKGIAFLTLPGLDLDTLKNKNAAIGEWPDASEAELTPFMKMMIGRNEEGRALLKAVGGLNLQDLTKASDDQIKVVTKLVWEIKGMLHALINGKTSDVLGNLNVGGGAKLSPNLVADLTASIPRDVVASAQQEWLPNLATELTNGPTTSPVAAPETNADGATAAPPPSEPEPEPESESGTEPPATTDVAEVEPAGAKETECAGEQIGGKNEDAADSAAPESDVAIASPEEEEEAESAEEQSAAAAKGRLLLPTGTPRSIKARLTNAKKKAQSKGEIGTADEKTDGGTNVRCATDGTAPDAEVQDAASAADTAVANADAGEDAPAAAEQPSGKETDQFDDLLYPNEEELRAAKAASKGSGQASEVPDADAATQTNATAPAGSPPNTNSAETIPQAETAPEISIESDVDPESWAEYGGWYRQDYAIFYRPTGHKDKFVYSWLSLTGPQAPKGDSSQATAVFDALTAKDAQGSCTKCHSVDDIRGKGRLVNFSPVSVKSKQGRFTNFIHEPHMGVMDDRGCLTCHELQKGRPYLKNYEQGNSKKFVSGFGAVKKELCQTCHASDKARQDCMLCHKYHVNGATSPIIKTKIPIQ